MISRVVRTSPKNSFTFNRVTSFTTGSNVVVAFPFFQQPGNDISQMGNLLCFDGWIRHPDIFLLTNTYNGMTRAVSGPPFPVRTNPSTPAGADADVDLVFVSDSFVLSQ